MLFIFARMLFMCSIHLCLIYADLCSFAFIAGTPTMFRRLNSNKRKIGDCSDAHEQSDRTGPSGE